MKICRIFLKNMLNSKTIEDTILEIKKKLDKLVEYFGKKIRIDSRAIAVSIYLFVSQSF